MGSINWIKIGDGQFKSEDNVFNIVKWTEGCYICYRNGERIGWGSSVEKAAKLTEDYVAWCKEIKELL